MYREKREEREEEEEKKNEKKKRERERERMIKRRDEDENEEREREKRKKERKKKKREKEKEKREEERRRGEIPPNSGLTYRHYCPFFTRLIAGYLTDKIDFFYASHSRNRHFLYHPPNSWYFERKMTLMIKS